MDVIHNAGTVQIGTEFYQLVKVGGDRPRLAWEETFEDENAFQGGTPNILFAPADTWHMGGFKSREGYPGTSEYGQNTDGRWPNKLIPGPKISDITLPDSVSPPSGFFECFGRLFVVAPWKVYRIDPADDSVTLSKAFASATGIGSGLRWESKALVATGTGESNLIFKLYELGSPDNWESGDAVGWRLAAGLDRLFKVDANGLLKNLLTGLEPITEVNWADEVQCGDAAAYTAPSGLVAYERTALVGREDSLYGVSEEGKGIPLISNIARNDNNFKGMAIVPPYVWLPHSRGLYRFAPGWVESIGLEREMLNESVVRGRFEAFVVDGQWVYEVLITGANLDKTYILVSRGAREEEQTLAPLVRDTLLYMDADCEAIHLSTLWDPPRLFFGNDLNVSYVKLSKGFGAPDPEGSDYRFVTSAVRYTHRYHFGDWKDKDFLRVKAVGKGCDATTYWKISYSVDGSAYSDTDIDGVEMRVDEDKLHTFTLPVSAEGMEVQFKQEYTGASDSAMGQLTHFKPYAVPTALKLRHYNLTLHLASETRHDGGVEQRTSLEQLNDLYALSESVTGVDCKGPWGDITVHPRRIRVLEVAQEGHGLPHFLVELVAQKRETS